MSPVRSACCWASCAVRRARSASALGPVSVSPASSASLSAILVVTAVRPARSGASRESLMLAYPRWMSATKARANALVPRVAASAPSARPVMLMSGLAATGVALTRRALEKPPGRSSEFW